MLSVTFLGTSAARPTVERNVSALALVREGETLLFECGEGTLGKVATDTMLYKNLTETLGSLSELLKDLKERPGRYLTVKVF